MLEELHASNAAYEAKGKALWAAEVARAKAEADQEAAEEAALHLQRAKEAMTNAEKEVAIANAAAATSAAEAVAATKAAEAAEEAEAKAKEAFAWAMEAPRKANKL